MIKNQSCISHIFLLSYDTRKVIHMKLYHGSATPDIAILRPFASNHDKPYVYLSHSEVLATIYAHNPLTRPNGFFTYWWRKDGILCYDEYFQNQLEEIYAGQTGYVYECEGQFPQLERMPWVYLSQEEVPVLRCRKIPDLYQQLLQYEKEGLLFVQRYDRVSEKQREVWANVVRRSLQQTDLSTPEGMEYAAYVRAHFPSIYDRSQQGTEGSAGKIL